MMEKIERMDSENTLPDELKSELTSRSGSFDSGDLFEGEDDNEVSMAIQELYKKIKKKVETRDPK